MYIPPDVILVFLALCLLWSCDCGKEKAPAAKPTPKPPSPEDNPTHIMNYTSYRKIAIARSDWRAADMYAADIARMRKEHADYITAYNQALRDRILKG